MGCSGRPLLGGDFLETQKMWFLGKRGSCAKALGARVGLLFGDSRKNSVAVVESWKGNVVGTAVGEIARAKP